MPYMSKNKLLQALEEAEDNSPTMTTFVENLLREKLENPALTKLRIERAQ